LIEIRTAKKAEGCNFGRKGEWTMKMTIFQGQRGLEASNPKKEEGVGK